MSETIPIERQVEPEHAGCRIDVFLARQFPEFSRALLRRAINANNILIGEKITKTKQHLKKNEQLKIILPEQPHAKPVPEDIPLNILYEDEHLAAINKPPAMVVHPAKGNWSSTLTSALAFHFQRLSRAGSPTRPGIMHQLDRNTNNVLLITKTNQAHFTLSKQFKTRTIKKKYFTIIMNTPNKNQNIIDQPINMHPYQHEKMAIHHDHPSSRPAQTFYEITERFQGFAAVRIKPKTKRTHQIRVHMTSIGCPVLCDKQYSGRSQITHGEIRHDLNNREVLLNRQALHARRLKITHPVSGEVLKLEAPITADLQLMLDELRKFRA